MNNYGYLNGETLINYSNEDGFINNIIDKSQNQ